MRLDPDQCEWDASEARAGTAFERVGPHSQRLLRQAWAICPWSDAQKRAAVANLVAYPTLRREAAALAMLSSFNPDPPHGLGGHQFVTVTDLEPCAFLQAFVAKLPPDPEQRSVAAPHSSSAAPHESRTADKAELWGPWPAPENDQERLRRAAVAYFGGRLSPFTEQEIDDLLSCTRYTVARLWRDAQLKKFVKGKVVRYPIEQVYKLLQKYTV